MDSKPGQLAMLMGKHAGDGTFKPMSPQQVSNSIAQAVRMGFLDPSSKAACLVLPASEFASNLRGWDKLCATHYGKHSVPRRFRPRPNEENLEKRDSIPAGQRSSLSLSA
ncbi:hypothetical protein [Mycolicibacterium mengxianglii]|uniref:hypothetical protein n=1 Tax=Mycolicibacterium mengxianglii TaxID=2736649 RepID=UPI0018D141CC|nr:hypothetical protein [Mycolicibacterium mengxianglii]